MNVTQRELGIRIGVKQSYISRIEGGDIESLTIGKMLKLSEVLHVDPVILLQSLLDAREWRINNG